MGGAFDMEKCIKCGGTLPAKAKLCPYCGNPVSYYEEKKQPVQPATRKQAGGRTILIVAVVVLSVLLISSLAFAITQWTASPAASPKLGVSPGSLDFGTLQVGSQSSQVLTLSNSGKQDLNWSADKGKADWLTVDPSQGRILPEGSQAIYVRADTTLLTAGRYSASISFSSNGGGASISAILIVASRPLSPGTPVVSSISPTSGPAAGGTTVTITGSGFTGASQVLFGTATSTFSVNSDTQITVVSPAGSGMVYVTVTTPKGTSATSIADQFTYQGTPPIPPIPTIASISPTSGPTTGGTTVTITGSGFTGVSQVLFGTTAVSFTVNSDKQITAVSPAGSGTVDVKVTTPGGTSATSSVDKFTYVIARPTIKQLSATSGPVTGGTKVIIAGSGFTGASKVLFGTISATSFTVNSATQITAVSPAGSGTVDVKVTTPGGTSATSSVDRFTYVPAPTVTGISTNTGPAAGGTSVIIRGSNFAGASKVLFGTIPTTSFTVNSATQITAVSPAGSGTVDVKVTTPGGTSTVSSVDRFTYVPAPTVTGISTNTGPAAGGTTVTITGRDFTGASKVLFGTVPATSFTVNSATQITAVSPASTGGSGTVDVKVTTPGGTSVTSSADRFTYVYALPAITSISPTSGPTTGGTLVTITGSNFTGASKVLFGTIPASIKTVSDTQITAVSPAGSGTVDVKVTTPGGTSAVSSVDRFTYVPAPTVTGISTNTGPAAGGTTVIITGSNFTGASKVLFGSVPATSFTVNSAMQITAVSPAGSGTVDVTVTTPGGISATSSADRFTYVPAPTVTGISTNTGPAAGGTTVTITGSNFTGASKVLFGSVATSIITVSDTQITVTSPAGSGTVDVTVTTPGGTSAITAADRFQYSG